MKELIFDQIQAKMVLFYLTAAGFLAGWGDAGGGDGGADGGAMAPPIFWLEKL